MENRNDYDLNSALARCRQSAQNGYEIASAQLGIIERTLRSAREETERSVTLLNGKSVYLADLNRLLSRQIKDICKAFDELSEQPREQLKKLHGNLSSFNITLFGRTMAGKSTLMEVLTHGDGKAIGNGAQRKTRDIRSYEWNGLRITDVPGIGAFNGQKDEDIAFEAAKNADMILFLMTDDGVQSQEAECFRSILEVSDTEARGDTQSVCRLRFSCRSGLESGSVCLHTPAFGVSRAADKGSPKSSGFERCQQDPQS